MALSPNTTLAHYRIISKLGAGGMGEVYLAQDTKLDRRVALKILPADLASNQDRMRRFVQEAKSAAALNHPNIATIYEIGESDVVNFIAMEFIDGHTLRDEIHQERTSLPKLLKHLHQIAEGLAKAHAAGIVHRDLKPDNVMITRDGHAKILDFGLAKLAERWGEGETARPGDEEPTVLSPRHPSPPLSTPGAIVGTVGYMSPEQAKAKPVDQRSDVFSFGCVLYEATTGHKPFDGDSVVDTLHKIIHDPAPAIADTNPNAPTELQRIIRKCLAKEPEKRYQLIRETANDLEEVIEELKGVGDLGRSVAPSTSVNTSAVSSAQHTQSVSATSSAEYVVSGIKRHKLGVAAVAVILASLIGGGYFFWQSRTANVKQISSIAVLPFENRSGNEDADYLSDGLSDSLIFRLTQLPNLKVSPTSSVIRYKGKPTEVAEIAKELEVDAVMSGKLAQRGDDLTISVELIDARTKKLIWAEQYDRKMSDLLATQREIASTIVEKLQLKLSGNETGLSKKYTSSNEAYELYLRGRFHFARRTKIDLERSIDLLQQATKLDPMFALAYVGIAEAYSSMTSFPYISPKEAYRFSNAAITKALELDPDLPEAHTVAGMIASTYEWDYAKAERELKRGIELGPNLAITHFRYGWTHLSALGRHNEAISELKRAMEIEPLSVQQGSNYSAVLLYAGRFDEALDQARKTYELDPGQVGAQNWLCHQLNAKRLYSEAITIGERAAATQFEATSFNACLGVAYAKSGQREKSLAIMNKVKEIAKTRVASSYWFAVHYAALGDKDAAFAELETAFQNRDWFLRYLRSDPYMDPLRDHPRFDALVKRLNFPK